MMDLSVVIQKLQGFETADTLADHFRGYGIKAQPRSARSCPIAQYVSMETGLSGIVVNTCSVRLENDEGDQLNVFPNSGPMCDFVEMYDKGYYPDLIAEGFEIDETYNCCPSCG
jgi:hypothetical protein